MNRKKIYSNLEIQRKFKVIFLRKILKIQQICPKTKQILKTYDSNRDVIKLFKMSVTSLKKYSECGEIHNGYIWKIC